MFAGDDKDDWDTGDRLPGSSFGHEHCRIVFSNIHGLFSGVGRPSPHNGLDVMCLAKCGLRERLTLRELHLFSTNERCEAYSVMAEARRLEERVLAAEEDSEATGVARMRVD